MSYIDPKRILVIRLSSIGDIILSFPLLRIIKQSFPEAQVHNAIKSQYLDLIKENPNIDQIYLLDTTLGLKALINMKRQFDHYDLVVDIHNNFRSIFLRGCALHTKIVKVKKYKFKRFLLVNFRFNLYRSIIPVYKRYIHCLSMFGIKDDDLGLEFYLDSRTEEKINWLLKDRGVISNILSIAIAPGASFATKRWPREYFLQLIGIILNENNAQIFLLGDEEDSDSAEFIKDKLGKNVYNFTGQLSLMETACVMNSAHLIISNDTGLMHLATALKKPTVAIFGSTVKELGFFPYGENVRIVENKKLKCRPCSHVGRKKCHKKHFRCMKELYPELVYREVSGLLSNVTVEKKP